ncbi:3176_t:CDS:2 [Acaulospora morrowiae]|uniref:3176_t:CDS:1 n=1 Tax=Acaulospora morrowiae TaxID=94023 RepID=A0A9N9BV69_9GLOM|nr:3176_t:CDS:2 [Acaulospora morrowiae]
MIDVAPSVSLDQRQRLDCPHDPVSFPAQYNFTPAFTTFPTNLQNSDLNLSLLGGFDFSSEQAFDSTPLDLQNWTAFLSMLQQVQMQQSSQDLPHSQTSSPSHQRQFNEMNYHQNQYSGAQQTMLPLTTPPFVEPSANYFEVPSTVPASYFASLVAPPPTLPASSVNGPIGPRGYANATGVAAAAIQHNYQQHHPSSRNSQLLATNNFQLTQGNSSYNNNDVPDHHYLPQRMIYAGAVPSLNAAGTRPQPQNQYHRKPIPVINTSLPPSPASTFSRPNSAASSPVSSTVTQPLLTPTIAQVLNTTDNGHDENTMHLPMFESNNSSTATWTSPTATTITIPQNISVSSSPEITSPITPTYSYSGPPKSYYSRLPLYDRPFKCDQCPQSFNRNHDLKRHKRIHLAVKPYPCQYCRKQFSRKDALKRHILVKGCNDNSVNKSSNSSTNSTGSGQVTSTGDSSSTTSPNAGRNYKIENRGPVNPIKIEPNSDNVYYGI